LPFWGTIGCLLDQQNNPSLIPLFIAFVIVSFGLLIRPWIAMLVFGINYAVFYFGLAVTQSNAQLVGFNRLAGFWCMATSIGLSIIFWRNNLIKLKHKKIIEEQGNELQANYNQLIETTAELKKSMSAKDHFFSILSHDLRGPLTSTLSLTQMITENSFGGDENEKHNAMKLIESTLQNSIALFDDILVWSATQSNRMPFIQENLHLRDVVNNNMQLLMLGAHKKSLVLVNQINNDFWINADRNMLNTILRNLLANAIKFSKQGGKKQQENGWLQFL
jgi:signal transduction histidine kinase